VKLTIWAEGRLRDPALRTVADDYKGRIARYARCDEIEVRDQKELRRRLPPGALWIALEVRGKAMSSEAFSQYLFEQASQGKKEICFLIGGAEGLDPELSKQAALQLSLSTMTLPHRLARVLLLEQLYRAMTIHKGEPYAREG
jgi:23S rRNA (pseudouridine1915-N3)-methyltransferase